MNYTHYVKYQKKNMNVRMVGGAKCINCNRGANYPHNTCCGACNKMPNSHTVECSIRNFGKMPLCNTPNCCRLHDGTGVCCNECPKSKTHIHTDKCDRNYYSLISSYAKTPKNSQTEADKRVYRRIYGGPQLDDESDDESDDVTPPSVRRANIPPPSVRQANIPPPLFSSTKQLKICSWNILAEELLVNFWGEYKLQNLKPSEKESKDMAIKRSDKIVSILEQLDCDIICLQEITNTKYNFNSGLKTIHEYIAEELRMDIKGAVFKNPYDGSRSTPPKVYRDNIPIKVQTGICILHKRSVPLHSMPSIYLNGSLINICQIGNSPICIVNVHYKYNGDLVSDMSDVSDRLPQLLPIFVGDFNVGHNYHNFVQNLGQLRLRDIGNTRRDDVIFGNAILMQNILQAPQFNTNMPILISNSTTPQTYDPDKHLSDHYPLIFTLSL